MLCANVKRFNDYMYLDIAIDNFMFMNFITLLSKSESVKFSLIESVICLFTDSSVNK